MADPKLFDAARAVNYRPAISFLGYQVGDDGSVWSSWDHSGKQKQSWHALVPQVSKHGYARVPLTRNRKTLKRSVHALVLEAFVGPRPQGYHACHANGCRGDNRLSNLRWDTPSANQGDRVAHGTNLRGSRHPAAKLAEEQAVAISQSAGSQRQIASRFGVSRRTVCDIQSGRSWGHVTGRTHDDVPTIETVPA